MRMWGISPECLCDKHLLGEHVEMHMFVGTINKGVSIQGYINNKLVNPRFIKLRHSKIAAEMERRGIKHQSPLPEYKEHRFRSLDISGNILDLMSRCPECQKRLLNI